MSTKWKNPRELEEMEEDERVELDQEIATPKEDQEEDKTDWKTRYAELRRYQQQKEAEKDAELVRLRKQLTGIQDGTVKPPKSREEIDQWKDTYPEFADVLDTWIKEAVTESTRDLRKQAVQAKREKALSELKQKHPDVEGHLMKGSDFMEWLQDQSQVARDYIFNSFNVKEASYVLDRFKAEKKIPVKSGGASDDEENDFSAAKSVRVKSTPNLNENSTNDGYEFSESQIERETDRNPKWWDANEEKILNALRRGKVKLDLSGGAR